MHSKRTLLGALVILVERREVHCLVLALSLAISVIAMSSSPITYDALLDGSDSTCLCGTVFSQLLAGKARQNSVTGVLPHLFHIPK